jgi:hypothetical protein
MAKRQLPALASTHHTVTPQHATSLLDREQNSANSNREFPVLHRAPAAKSPTVTDLYPSLGSFEVLADNSHLSNTHRYQVTGASCIAAQGVSPTIPMKKRRRRGATRRARP